MQTVLLLAGAQWPLVGTVGIKDYQGGWIQLQKLIVGHACNDTQQMPFCCFKIKDQTPADMKHPHDMICLPKVENTMCSGARVWKTGQHLRSFLHSSRFASVFRFALFSFLYVFVTWASQSQVGF